jgi:hypothetical protein
MRLCSLWIVALALLLANVVVPARANLVANPGFESCAPSEQPADWLAYSANIQCSSNSHSGSWSVSFGGLAGDTLSQSIATVAGDSYDFSFWLEDGASAPDSFTASFGADEVLDLVNPGGFGYTLEDFTVTATGTTTTIAFAASPNFAFWYLDDVSVTQTASPVPEPASLALLALLGGGLLCLGRFHRRPC